MEGRTRGKWSTLQCVPGGSDFFFVPSLNQVQEQNDIKLKGLNWNFISRLLNIQFGSFDRISGDEIALQMKSILVFLYLLIKI